MDVYYENHKKQKIDLGDPPYQMQIGNLFDYSHKYDGINGKVSRIYKDTTQIPTVLTINSDDEEEFCEALNHFFEVVETDTATGVQGRLYIGEYYLKCNIIASQKSFWRDVWRGVENSVKILAPHPYWCREVCRSFFKETVSAGRDSGGWLKYPISYPYTYSMPGGSGNLDNDHFAECDFLMRIYGPCTDPMVRINGHLYGVEATLSDGEHIEVDSRDRTILKFYNNGETENLFNSRNKEYSIFQKIPAGICSVKWEAYAFGFDITLLQERGEPKWTL